MFLAELLFFSCPRPLSVIYQKRRAIIFFYFNLTTVFELYLKLLAQKENMLDYFLSGVVQK